jgi:hypothetical protein
VDTADADDKAPTTELDPEIEAPADEVTEGATVLAPETGAPTEVDEEARVYVSAGLPATAAPAPGLLLRAAPVPLR